MEGRNIQKRQADKGRLSQAFRIRKENAGRQRPENVGKSRKAGRETRAGTQADGKGQACW